MVDVKELRRLLAEATERPWYASDAPYGTPDRLCPHTHWDDETDWSEEKAAVHRSHTEQSWTVSRAPDGAGWNTDGGYPGYGLCQHDADLIAAAVNALPALLDELESARAALTNAARPVAPK